jgi:transposase
MEKYKVTLTKEERKNLLLMLNRGKESAKKLTHARILLGSDEGEEADEKKSYVSLAKELHVSVKMIERVRKQFVEEGLEAALNRRPYPQTRVKKLQGKEEAHLVALCCSKAPEGRTRWTLKLLAKQLVALEIVPEISASTVGRTLKKMN